MTDHFDHTEEVIADLQAAKEYLLEHGWSRGWGSCLSGTETTCAMGAINYATLGSIGHEQSPEWTRRLEMDNDRRLRACGALRDVLLLPFHSVNDIAVWNDRQAADINEVIEAFDAAIIKLKENHGD